MTIFWVLAAGLSAFLEIDAGPHLHGQRRVKLMVDETVDLDDAFAKVAAFCGDALDQRVHFAP